MILNHKERDIIACTELRTEMPIEQIRKETGYREHTIRYCLNRLQEKGIILMIPIINTHAIGYTHFNLYFSFSSSQKKKTKEELLRSMAIVPSIIWLGEIGGGHQYGVEIVTKSVYPMLDILGGLSRRFPDIFFEKQVSCKYSRTIFSHKFLSTKKFSSPSITIGRSKEIHQIDDLDHKVLQGLVSKRYRSHRDLALQIAVPLSTLELRIKKLEERGILMGFSYAVNTRLVGLQSYSLLIFARGVNPDLVAALHQFAETHPHITFILECLGIWDIELGIEVDSSEKVTEIIEQIYERFSGSINNIQVLNRFRDLKLRYYPA